MQYSITVTDGTSVTELGITDDPADAVELVRKTKVALEHFEGTSAAIVRLTKTVKLTAIDVSSSRVSLDQGKNVISWSDGSMENF